MGDRVIEHSEPAAGDSGLPEEPIQVEEELEFLDPQRVRIRRNAFDELEVELPDGTVQAPVEPARSFPVSQPEQFVVLLDRDRTEIGIFEDIRQLPKEDRQLLQAELEKVYFMPRITRVLSIEGQFGVTRWEVETDRGPARVDLRSRYDIVLLGEGRLLIKDVDGNRFEILDYHHLDPQSVALIETQI